MIFHFEMSSNDVRRNTDFVLVISGRFNNTSIPIYEDNFRRAVAFYTCRSGGIIDSRNKKNWAITSDYYTSPKKEN
jgi:hypothetical protein